MEGVPDAVAAEHVADLVRPGGPPPADDLDHLDAGAVLLRPAVQERGDPLVEVLVAGPDRLADPVVQLPERPGPQRRPGRGPVGPVEHRHPARPGCSSCARPRNSTPVVPGSVRSASSRATGSPRSRASRRASSAASADRSHTTR